MSDEAFDAPVTSFHTWLTSARPGDNYTYYEGFLGDYITPPSPAEKAEGEAVLLAFSRGEVEIAQCRVKPAKGKVSGSFQYIAQKRRYVRPPTAAGEKWQLRFVGPGRPGYRA